MLASFFESNKSNRVGGNGLLHRLDEFIRKVLHTPLAYAAAVTRFFTWCDARGLALTQL